MEKTKEIEQEEKDLSEYIEKSFRHGWNRAKLSIEDLREICSIIRNGREWKIMENHDVKI